MAICYNMSHGYGKIMKNQPFLYADDVPMKNDDDQYPCLSTCYIDHY